MTTAMVAMAPLAPARVSTTTGWASTSLIFGAMAREGHITRIAKARGADYLYRLRRKALRDGDR